MIVRKTLLAASVAALMSTPAWALPSKAPSNPGTGHAPSTTPVGPPSTTPNNTSNPGSANRNSHANKGDKGSSGANKGQGSGGSNPGDKGKGMHKCTPHKVGYVASGMLVKQTLTKNADGTYSGEVEVEVVRTNHHAATDKGKTVDYKVVNAHVMFGLKDTNNDGSVGLDDLAKGDRVHLNGKITVLTKKCNQRGFTAETTIRQIVFHTQASPASSKS